MENPKKNKINFHQRSGVDRRKESRINIRSLIFGGRRKNIRRREDKQKFFFVDQYNAFYFSAIVIILVLSAADALLTLFLINNGAIELNPIMAFYIQVGPYWFFATKYALTSVGVFTLLIFRYIYIKPFKIPTGSMLYFFVAVFITIVSWQFYLISNLMI